ncbi:MAG: NUDIX domain-containing protein [Zetaproteobacteria bacterium]|nr:MAG: NUDIX domain-containing protein [Zetaproteobacteria bacterium]
MIRIALVAACDEEARILLLQRRPDQSFAGMWSLPGGKIEPGEAPLRAARRELWEETGLSGSSWRRLGVVRGNKPYVRFYLFSCRVTGDPPRPEARYRWAELQALSRLPMPPANEAIVHKLMRVASIAPSEAAR